MTSKEYVQGAVRTNSGRYDVDHVQPKTLAAAFALFVAAGKAIDAIKRALYYGKPLDQTKIAKAFADAYEATQSFYADPSLPGCSVNLPGYHSCTREDFGQIVHAAAGMATESAEVVEEVLNGLKNETFDYRNLFEEIGDLNWYQALAMKTAGIIDPNSVTQDEHFGSSKANLTEWTYEGIWEANIAKLKARYPDKFSTEKAFERDLTKEKAALNGVRL